MPDRHRRYRPESGQPSVDPIEKQQGSRVGHPAALRSMNNCIVNHGQRYNGPPPWLVAFSAERRVKGNKSNACHAAHLLFKDSGGRSRRRPALIESEAPKLTFVRRSSRRRESLELRRRAGPTDAAITQAASRRLW